MPPGRGHFRAGLGTWVMLKDGGLSVAVQLFQVWPPTTGGLLLKPCGGRNSKV